MANGHTGTSAEVEMNVQLEQKKVGRNQTADYSVVSLFSGCGGLDLGFLGGFDFLGKHYERHPFQIAWANDISPQACQSYRDNLGHDIVCGDIREVFSQIPSSADVVIGGFPCQDISINGKRKGVIKGNRSSLYTAMVDTVAHCQPKVFVAENVKGLLMSYNKNALKQVLADFKELGYDVTYKLYLAANYGVPQMRERVFIVGTKPGVASFAPPEPVTPKGSWITSKEAIGDLEGADENADFNHLWSLAAISPDQGQRMINADAPSTTIRAEHHGNVQFHYSLPRRISLREAARLQSFPDSFTFKSRMRQTERQIGNAVPPVLAWHIAHAVRECLHGTWGVRGAAP